MGKTLTLSIIGYSLPCDAGFICLEGSNVPNPTDGVIGYVCPTGHYCLSGAVTETPCDIGTYAPSTQLGESHRKIWNFLNALDEKILQISIFFMLN